LAGFHLNALKSEKLSKDYSKRQMLAYVEKVQRKEGKHKVDQLTH
jgi:isocitrate lyase